MCHANFLVVRYGEIDPFLIFLSSFPNLQKSQDSQWAFSIMMKALELLKISTESSWNFLHSKQLKLNIFFRSLWYFSFLSFFFIFRKKAMSFKFPKIWKVVTSYYSYEFLTMIAEVGGYVGLFLGRKFCKNNPQSNSKNSEKNWSISTFTRVSAEQVSTSGLTMCIHFWHVQNSMWQSNIANFIESTHPPLVSEVHFNEYLDFCFSWQINH